MAKTKQGTLLDAPTTSRKKNQEFVDYRTELYPGIDLSIAASALQKSIRRGNEELALKMAFLILTRFPFYCIKRLQICASEDVGSADPQAAILASAIGQAWQSCRARSAEFKGRVMIAHLVLYLCRAPKNREADHGTIYIGAQLDQKEPIEIPEWVYDKHTRQGKNLKRGFAHFVEEGSKLVNESGEDNYKWKMIDYLKRIGQYK